MHSPGFFLEEVFKHLPNNTSKNIVTKTCAHDNTCRDENEKKVCIDCGELLEESYTLTLHYTNGCYMTNRKSADPSIYSEIPDFVNREIKELTVQIYEVVTKKKPFRNRTKKAIVLACLHRAASLKDMNMSYYDLLEMFELQQHEANTGFIYLSSNIPKNSSFFKLFDHKKEEIMGINSKLKRLQILENDSSLFRLVVNTFFLLKENSNAVNSSQYSSVICGCIYFWVVYLNIPIKLEHFTEKAELSTMTLLKNYTSVCDVVFNYILKDLFSELLKNCTHVVSKNNVYKNKFPKKTEPSEMLYEPEENFVIKKPFDPLLITAEIDGCLLPLNHVDDTLEWNLLLNKCYFSTGVKIMLCVSLLKKNEKDMYFDFSQYNKYNNKDGKSILNQILISKFDHEIK